MDTYYHDCLQTINYTAATSVNLKQIFDELSAAELKNEPSFSVSHQLFEQYDTIV